MIDKRSAETRPSRRPFPVAGIWEELRVSWERSSDDEESGADVAIRNEIIRLISRATNKEVPVGLIVDLKQILELTRPFQLGDHTVLAERLFQVAGRYLRPRHQAFFNTSARETKRLLTKILETAELLDELLEEASTEIVKVVEEAHAKLTEECGPMQRLNVIGFSTSLTHLRQAVAFLESSIVIPPNRPVEAMRKRAVIDAAEAIEEATGSLIELGARKSGTEMRERFKGASGAALLGFLKLIAPTVTEAALVGDLRAARKRLSREKSDETADF